MYVSNASMYDGASSFAESAFMACRLRKGKGTLLSVCNPEYRMVLKTYAHFRGVQEEFGYKDGKADRRP